MYLLPIIGLVLNNENRIKVNCLFDNGSQRSYISDKIVQSLNCAKSKLKKVEYQVNTSISSQIKTLDEVR